MRTIVWLFLVTVLVYGSLCAALFVFQRSLIYFPQPGNTGSPNSKMKLPVPDAELLILVRPHEGPKALIYFGGNAEDVSINLPSFSMAFPDHAIYLLNYRGYGGSSGKPSEELLQNDALALFDKVHIEHSDISIVGRSLGSGVAIRLASQRQVSRLILVTPYDSIQELAVRQFPYFPIRWLLTDKFESWRYAPTIRVPTLFLVAENDEVIPRSSTERLFASFNKGVASFTIIPNASHNTISNTTLYLEAIRGAL